MGSGGRGGDRGGGDASVQASQRRAGEDGESSVGNGMGAGGDTVLLPVFRSAMPLVPCEDEPTARFEALWAEAATRGIGSAADAARTAAVAMAFEVAAATVLASPGERLYGRAAALALVARQRCEECVPGSGGSAARRAWNAERERLEAR